MTTRSFVSKILDLLGAASDTDVKSTALMLSPAETIVFHTHVTLEGKEYLLSLVPTDLG